VPRQVREKSVVPIGAKRRKNNLNSSVDHDENSEYSVKTRSYRALCFHPMGESGGNWK
jgi:hypothetical protein